MAERFSAPQRPGVPAFTRRELAVQARESSAGYNFDSMLDATTCERVMKRMQVNPDTVRHAAQSVLDRIRFYDSVGHLVYEWVNHGTPSAPKPGGN